MKINQTLKPLSRYLLKSGLVSAESAFHSMKSYCYSIPAESTYISPPKGEGGITVSTPPEKTDGNQSVILSKKQCFLCAGHRLFSRVLNTDGIRTPRLTPAIASINHSDDRGFKC